MTRPRATRPIRVVIADDHPIIREGLTRLINLEPDMEVVAQAESGADLVATLAQAPCDVLVLDLSLKHIRGLELLALVKERSPALAVLIFSMQPEDNFSLHLIDAGASGYLCKDRGIEQVLAAIRAVARGDTFITERLAALRREYGRGALAPHQRLSAREHEVFVLLIEGHTVTAIAAALEISASTASNHLARVRQKLGVENNSEILVYAAKAGLL